MAFEYYGNRWYLIDEGQSKSKLNDFGGEFYVRNYTFWQKG